MDDSPIFNCRNPRVTVNGQKVGDVIDCEIVADIQCDLPRGITQLIADAITGSEGGLPETEDFESMAGNMLAMVRQLDNGPQPIHAMIARGDVPFYSGLKLRYYNTRGELIVYVNRYEVEALPRVPYAGAEIRPWDIVQPAWGTPVYFEDPS